MGKIADATFKGKVGPYNFGVYTTDTVFIDTGAVYIFSKRVVDSNGRGRHTFLYIGQTHSLEDRIPYHEKWSCAQRNGVNCICVHQDDDASSRTSKEADLLAASNPPCNKE
jgi:hypothetical protein